MANSHQTIKKTCYHLNALTKLSMIHLYLPSLADLETRNEFIVLDYWSKPLWWFDFMVFLFWGAGTVWK